jgi:type II secretory pathway component GspD/PulD (secretin)
MRKPAMGCRGGRERSGPWQGAFMNACKGSKLGLLVLGLSLVLSASASAQQQQPARGPAAAGDVGQKKVAFEMRDKPWGAVLEWLAKESGLPFYAGIGKPTGTFTYVGPAGLEMKTISEVIDILNTALRPQKYVILRHNQALTVVPADEPVPTADVPRLTNPDELNLHGNTELVSLVYHLKALNADEFAPQVKRMMSPFGTVTTLATTNTLVMQDDVATLKQLVAIIKEGENLDNRAGDSLTYRCEYIPARDAERKLKDHFGDPAKSPMEGTNPMMMPGMTIPGMPGAVPGMQFFMQDGSAGDPRAGRGRGNRGGGPGGRGGPAAAADAAGIKSVVRAITSDEATNTVFVSGPADKLAMARIMLKSIDVGTDKYVIGPAIMRTYSIPGGNAEAVAAMLTANFKDSNTVKITAIGNSSILVYAYPADHFRMAKDLETSKPPGGAVKIMLTTLDSNRVVETLKNIYSSGDGKSGYPYIETDFSDNAVIVKGSEEQISEVREIIKALGELPAGTVGQGASNLKIITLEKGNAAALAEAIQKAMEQLRQNPVNPNSKPATQPKEMKKDGGEEQDEPKTKAQLFDPQKQNDARPGDKKLPITITAIGNKIIINSDDPAALALAQELVRIYTQAPKGESGFQIIRLKNAKAMDAAKILDDAFNGPKQQPGINLPGFNQGGGGGRGGGGGANFFAQMMQAQSSQAAAKPRIRVVADPATNSLLVQASPLDMLEIKHLLDKAIDSDDTDSNAVLKTWPPIPLKYADASEVLTTLQSVYREYMTTGGGSGFSNIGPNGITVGSRFTRGGAVDANGNPRTVSLTMGLDARSNSIVLQCSELMYKDVKKLIEELDASAKDSAKTIKLVQIIGVDPMLVQEAIDVIQGRRSSGSSANNPMSNAFGGAGQNGQRGAGIGGGGQGFNGGGGQGFNGGGGQGFNGGGAGFGGGRGGAGFGGGGPGGFGGGGPGGFGGGNGGGGFGGGRGAGGGGAGGGGRGGAAGGGRGGLQRSLNNSPDGGPDFFEHGVKDDPQSFSLYDPRLDPTPTDLDMIRALAVGRAPEALADELLAIAAGEQVQPPGQSPITNSQSVPAPRNAVTAEVLPELGYIIISAQNPADVLATERIIKIIVDGSKGAEVNYKIFHLKYADATSVTATLNQLFSRVNVNSNGTGRIIQGSPQTNINTPGGNISAGQNIPAQNLVLLPLLRFNAIFVAAPKSRMDDIEKKLLDLDRPTAEISRAQPFPLKKASAARVASLVNTFYAARGESQNVNQIRITEDDTTNTVFVQAAPADMEDIRRLIEHLDRTPTGAINDLRIYHLKIALADELSNLLVSAIAQGVLSTGTTPTVAPTGGGIGGGGIGGIGGIGGFAGGAGGAAAARPATAGAAGGGTTAIAGAGGTPVTKNVGLHFIGLAGAVDGLVLEDIHITPDLRTNSLIISANERTMPMIWKLIEELDVAPTARAEIKIFPLKRADATALETILQNMFFGTTTNVPGSGTVTNSSAGGTATGAGAAPAGGGGGGGAGITGSGALGQSGPVPRAILQLPGQPAEGAPLVELHITADPRTNSLIVAGGRNELLVIDAIILRLDEAPIAERMDEVVHIKNASAADVATALQNFIVAKLRIEVNTSQLNAYQEMLRDMIVIAEPFTNKLLISATPKYFGELMRLIKELDAQPPQVVIQVMIAEVDLSSTEEFGVEIGLQSPVLFQRGIFPNPASGFAATGTTVNFANSSTEQVVGTANGTVNPFANPGFSFNASPNFPALGNNPLASPGVVGVQGVGNLGVGRADSNGLSGFVFSAASNSFNLLVRALKTQGRIDILSRPQIMTLDNQTATINIGQQIPYVGSTTLVAGGLSQQNIERVIVGVNLQVTPRITAEDGTVLMRVTPSVSSPVATQINLGNGILATAFNVQQVDTTVQARDGETVCIGGLITKNETKNENKIPVLGDLPFFGALFRYRTQQRAKTELLVIMTPHIVHSKMDVERILGEEARRMDWIMSDVLRTHGTYGMEPAIPKKDPSGAQGGANCAPGALPGGEMEGPAPVPMTAPPSAPMSRLPGQPQAYNMPSQQFQPVAANSMTGNGGAPSGYVQGTVDNNWSNPAMAAPQGYPTQAQAQQGYTMQPQTQPNYQPQPQMPADPAASQPSSQWNFFGRQQQQ